MNPNTKNEPITLYHCPQCDYEAGTKAMVIKHIKEKHD